MKLNTIWCKAFVIVIISLNEKEFKCIIGNGTWTLPYMRIL